MNFNNEPKPKGLNPKIIGGLLLVFCIIVAVVVYFMYSDNSPGSSSTIKEEEESDEEEEEPEPEPEPEPLEAINVVVGSSAPPSSVMGSSSSYSSVLGSSSSSSSVPVSSSSSFSPLNQSIYKIVSGEESGVEGDGGVGFKEPTYNNAPHTLDYQVTSSGWGGFQVGWSKNQIMKPCDTLTIGSKGSTEKAVPGDTSLYDACYIRPNGNYMCLPVTSLHNQGGSCKIYSHKNRYDDVFEEFIKKGAWKTDVECGEEDQRVELRHRTIPR